MMKMLPAATVLAVVSFNVAGAEAPFRSIEVGPNPESVVRGFDGKLCVSLMGVKREKGDGDGAIVVVDGDKVTTLATGLDDPKGLGFVRGQLVTADFDQVWAVDAKGTRTLLAGPDAFPAPPLFLNDVFVETDGRTILVTDMGDVSKMTSSDGAFWPLDSDQAKNLTPRGRVYRITLNGQVSVVIDHASEMPDPNGVDELDDGTILVDEFFRGTLLAWKAGRWRTISDDHRSADGIVHDRSGKNYYVTEVRTGRVWSIEAATGEKHLLAKLESAADLYLDEPNHQLIVPDSKAGKLVFIPLPHSAR